MEIITNIDLLLVVSAFFAGASARAAFNLGQCYFGAQGIDQDIPKALAAWKKAAEMGDGRAAANAAR